MRWLGVALLCGLWATTAQAVPKVPAKVLMSPNGRAVVEIELEKEKPAAWRSAFADEDCFVDELRPLRPNTIRLIVLPSKAGIYRVILWDGVKVEDSVVLVIDATGGKPVPPTPDPVVPKPDGKLGLIKASREGLAKVNPKAGDVEKLITAQRSVRSAVAAGGLVTPADILKGWRDANNAAVDATVWQKWGVDVSGLLQKLYTDGKLKDKSDWALALEEITQGLEGN